jgi:EAL domain-containing protein (putative c-di-GMP-specific phosphodiesterase class I)
LLSVIHGLDTEILLEGIRTGDDCRQAQALRASLVKGDYYEQALGPPALAKAG